MMKKGISLIVLVITIIVMIILAASVVITLSNTGVINRASEAVDATNQSQVQDLAALVWADAYMDNKRGTALETEVTTKLEEQGITADKWNITVTDTGVTVTSKNLSTTLGSLIKGPEDYGKTVDYKVTGTYRHLYCPEDPLDCVDTRSDATVTEWQVYYEDEKNGYVYIIASEPVVQTRIDWGGTVPELTEEDKSLYSKFQVGEWPKYTIGSAPEGRDNPNKFLVQLLVKEYSTFANKELYGDYVIGAIGGPTLELFASAWNAKGYSPELSLSISTENEYGYLLNSKSWFFGTVSSDGLYIPSNQNYYLASPGSGSNVGSVWLVGRGNIESNYGDSAYSVRPVVCLSSNIPAQLTADGYTLGK